MDTQLLVVLICISLAGLYLLVCGYRAWRKLRAGGCSSGCGCNQTDTKKSPELIESKDLMARLKERQMP